MRAEKDEGAPQPSKEHVIAALEALNKQIEEGKLLLGQNEHGEDFVEIHEEWDAHGTFIQSSMGDTSISKEQEEDENYDEEEGTDFDQTLDEDEFELLMQQMEEIDDSQLDAKDRKQTKKPGIKKGFLLDSSAKASMTLAEVPATEENKQAHTTNIHSNNNKSASPFIGDVIERNSAGSVTTQLNTKKEEEQKPISRFKKRQQQQQHYM